MTDLARLFAADGPLARQLVGYRPRRGQLEMAEAVAAALATRGQLLVEAGTGTGKTFAYLVPALLSGRHVVVSTGTRSLQDQLYHRDLPLLAGAIGRPVKVALLKGRANYLCRQRLNVSLASPELTGLEARHGRYLKRVERWAAGTTRGDIAELASVPESHPVWAAVTSTRENCLGQACPEYRDCHIAAARREAQAADLVIVNHHLLLADMTLKEEGFGELLPGADAVILDEAHQFPDTAAQFFGVGVTARALDALARDAGEELVRAGLADPEARAALAAVEAAASTLSRSLASLGNRIDWPGLPDVALETAHELAALLAALGERLDDPDLEAAGLRQCGRRARELGARLAELLALPPEAGVKWAELTARGFSLQFTPFEVAPRLASHIAARPCAWIYTSATLAVGTDFSHFAARVAAAGAPTLHIASPFDYERNARLYLPQGLPDPAERGHTQAVIRAALPVLRAAGGRAFLLFTSHRALNVAAESLRAAAQDEFRLLVQGEAPRDALLREFRSGERAVLLGTSSFWEGVDVRGPALSVVVIDKLPFASPDDPVLKARLEGLRREGKNGFFLHQLPQAVLALKQGTGRLIRDVDDVGVIVLCDPRLRSKGYGSTFLASLPPMTVTDSLAEVTEFLARHLGPVPQVAS